MSEAHPPVESALQAKRSGWPIFVGGIAALFALFILGSSDGRQPGVDSHYHFMMAQEIAQGNLVPSMAEDLPLTIYKELDVDHYHYFTHDIPEPGWDTNGIAVQMGVDGIPYEVLNRA